MYNNNVSLERRLEWFANNADALAMVDSIIEMLHIWDDVVDRDHEVTEELINKAFTTALVHLPLNPFYRNIQYQIIPMWITVISSYETANKYEREQDEHGLGIGYTLRCAIGQIFSYAISISVNKEKAKEFIPEMWQWLLWGKFEDYRKEHIGA